MVLEVLQCQLRRLPGVLEIGRVSTRFRRRIVIRFGFGIALTVATRRLAASSSLRRPVALHRLGSVTVGATLRRCSARRLGSPTCRLVRLSFFCSIVCRRLRTGCVRSRLSLARFRLTVRFAGSICLPGTRPTVLRFTLDVSVR